MRLQGNSQGWAEMADFFTDRVKRLIVQGVQVPVVFWPRTVEYLMSTKCQRDDGAHLVGETTG